MISVNMCKYQFSTFMRFVLNKFHNLLGLIYNVDAFHARQTKPTENCIFQFQRVSFSRWAKYFSFGYFEILSLDFPSCQKIKCKFSHFQGNIKLDLCHGRYKMFLMQITKQTDNRFIEWEKRKNLFLNYTRIAKSDVRCDVI